MIGLFCCRYLYECLYSWLISALSRADSFMLEQDAITGGSGAGQNLPRLNCFLFMASKLTNIIKYSYMEIYSTAVGGNCPRLAMGGG